jgi:MATE family multidrug resistance protein
MAFSFFKNYHTKETIALAWPLVATQVGHIVTGIVDTIFLGQLGITHQAAGILSNSLYILLLVFTIGMSYALTPLVTEAHESSDTVKKAALFKNGLFLNFAVAAVCFALLFFCSPLMYYLQQPKEVVDMAIPFFQVLVFSMLPVSLFFSCKQYCEGLSNTRIALFISIVGNIANIILNYGLIYGKFGLPELGYMGSAWATFIARTIMGVAFVIMVFRSPLTREIASAYKKVKINLIELAALWRIGFNSAMQFTFEVAAFVIAGLLAGKFGKENIDAHGIALQLASFTYMFGSGIGSAATIRVGIYKSQNNLVELRHAVNAALKLVILVMGVCALFFIVLRSQLPGFFTSHVEVIELTSQLLLIAALFQLFDGLQVTLIGILRALQDIKFPTYATLVCYWVIALPLAWVLAFPAGLGTIGVWIALLVSLILVSAALYFRLRKLIGKF